MPKAKLPANQDPPQEQPFFVAVARLCVRFFKAPERWFALVAAIFGLAFVFATPLFATPDEPNHFYRAYQLANGQLLADQRAAGTGGKIPDNIALTVSQLTHQPDLAAYPNAKPLTSTKINDQSKPVFMRFDNTSLYNPLPYIPHILGILFGKAYDLTLIQTLYVGRIFNLAMYIILAYVAIRLLPFGKWGGVAVALLPMHVLLAGSLSSDPVSTGTLMLFVSALLWARSCLKPLRRGQLWLLLLLCAALALAKLPLPLFLGLVMLLPSRVFGGIWPRFRFTVAALALGTSLGVGWSLIAHALSSDFGPYMVDEARQIAFVAAHPVEFVITVVRTYYGTFGDTILPHYPISIGWMERWWPMTITLIYSVFLGLATIGTQASTVTAKRAVIGMANKGWLLFLATLSLLATGTLLYLNWSPVGSAEIEGLQARYFTPLLILLIPLTAVKSGLRLPSGDGVLPIAALRILPVVFLAAGLLLAVS